MIVRLLRPSVQRVVIASPLQVRATAHSKIKTDTNTRVGPVELNLVNRQKREHSGTQGFVLSSLP